MHCMTCFSWHDVLLPGEKTTTAMVWVHADKASSHLDLITGVSSA